MPLENLELKTTCFVNLQSDSVGIVAASWGVSPDSSKAEGWNHLKASFLNVNGG